jgi:hypothetical protein
LIEVVGLMEAAATVEGTSGDSIAVVELQHELIAESL